MDIHRKLRDLKQRRRRARRVRQLRLLAQQPKVRVLKQWADGRVRQLRVIEHMTKLRVLEQRANAHRHAHSGRGYQSGCLGVTSAPPYTGEIAGTGTVG